MLHSIPFYLEAIDRLSNEAEARMSRVSVRQPLKQTFLSIDVFLIGIAVGEFDRDLALPPKPREVNEGRRIQ